MIDTAHWLPYINTTATDRCSNRPESNMSRNTIEYNVCRQNLGDDTTDAQYVAYKALVQAALAGAFPAAEIEVGDSSFCNDSTCNIGLDCGDVTRDDVETVVSDIGEAWWDAE